MRVRISTTIDGERLEAARLRLGRRDSELFDLALIALLDTLDQEDELAAIEAHPYDKDPDLVVSVPQPFDESYDEAVPESVRLLAEQRRAARLHLP